MKDHVVDLLFPGLGPASSPFLELPVLKAVVLWICSLLLPSEFVGLVSAVMFWWVVEVKHVRWRDVFM